MYFRGARIGILLSRIWGIGFGGAADVTMEGWVNKKRTTTLLVGNAYKRRYLVLDSNNLITFEGYDISKKEPVGAKAGAVSLNGVEWELGRLLSKDHPYGLILSHQHLDSIYLSLETEDQMVAWKSALRHRRCLVSWPISIACWFRTWGWCLVGSTRLRRSTSPDGFPAFHLLFRIAGRKGIGAGIPRTRGGGQR